MIREIMQATATKTRPLMSKGENTMPQARDWQAPESILIVDDDRYVRDALESYLASYGYHSVVAGEAKSAIQLVEANNIIVGVIDLHLPGISGLELLREIHAQDSTIQCILLTGHGSMETAIEALREQAYDYIIKSSSLDSVERVIVRAAE